MISANSHTEPAEFQPTDKEQVVARLCRFVKEVWEAIDPNSNYACDCFCYESRNRRPEHFRNELTAIEFIETTVRKRLVEITKEREQLLARLRDIEAGRTA